MSKLLKPTNQVRLTNVAIVRLKKGGKKFEIACYKHKVLPWRNQLEQDINEVLQTQTIFLHVSKGQAAKKEDLINIFRTNDSTEICKEILKNGELQISDKDRQSQIVSLTKDIATSIADKCVNPNTKRPYPVSVIEKAMRDVRFFVNVNKSVVQQTLHVIELLKKEIRLQRAQMRVRILLTGKGANKIKNKIIHLVLSIEEEYWYSETANIICLIEPGNFKNLDAMIQTETKGNGQFELLNLIEMLEEDIL
ncbi:ribosome maturation protein SBDS-like [Galleria mellonella]|uniref:Ribosome maturation protein SBDS-like n=1 Tax=Galleria mellonella TaxID=7137 RepID=A0A6J3C8U8_GALME|nr:ribosome maturation protein SBDS-like [Galleria mellonella]